LRRAERLIIGSIDGAAHVLQREARGVLLGTALFMVPVVALGLVLSIIAYNDFDRFDGLLDDRGYIGVETGLVFVAVVLQSFTAHVVGAYAVVYLVSHQLGDEPRIGRAAGSVVRRLPLLVVTWALTHWWLVLVDLVMLNADPVTVAGLSWVVVPAAAFASTCVLFVVPVMMAEHLGLASIRRAWQLVRPRLGAAWGFVVACSVLGAVLLVFITYLPAAAEGTGLVTFGRFEWLVQGVMAQIALLVVVPFSALATAQFYLQTRVHTEGLDIVIAADRAFGPRP
jgi:hypothetical protein